MKKIAIFLALGWLLVGCSAGLFQDLAKDKASACGYSSVAYGGFTIAPAPVIPGMGVYVHQRFCRSNTDGSVVSIDKDGTISVSHGKATASPKATVP